LKIRLSSNLCVKPGTHPEQWILAYEANVHGWLPLSEHYVDDDDNFGRLEKADVSFLVLEDDDLSEEPDWDPYGTSEYEEEEREAHLEENEDESDLPF